MLLALVCVVRLFQEIRDSMHFRNACPATAGVVVEMVTRGGGKTLSHHPVVRYELAGGREVTAEDRVGSWRRVFEVGQRVRLYYDPALPTDFRMDTFGDLWMEPLGFLLLCPVLLLSALFLLKGRGSTL